MDVAAYGIKACRLFFRSAVWPGLILLAVMTSCPGVDPTDDGGDEPGDASPGVGDVTAQIVSPTTSFSLSLGDLPVAIRYTVTGAPDDIQGFYVPVADAMPGSAPIGDRVIIATDLPPGTNQFFNFQVDRVGSYRVGVVATIGSRQEIAESLAVIRVEGPPDPRFILPTDAVTEVDRGAEVDIRFDARDPENRVQWRLFYLTETDSRNASPAELGTQLTPGTGNVGSFTWSTGQLEPGDYELGVSATDSGASVASTAARGQLDRIVTIPNGAGRGPIVRIVEEDEPLLPTLTFLAPGTADVGLFRNEGFTIRVEARVREPEAAGIVELFYDDDRDDGNGFVSLATDNLAPESQKTLTVAFPTDLAEGTYNIGAKILDGINAPLTRYADGQVVVVRTVTLVVTAPSGALPVAPGDPVEVRWTTSAPESAGTVDVFAQKVDPESGLTFGDEIPILSGAAITATSATFTSSASGLFEISVRLNIIDGTPIQEPAPSLIRVSTLPRILWLGSLAENAPVFEGAIFGGVNFEDNAGTSFTTAGDLNGDGNDEFVIAARYGKPFFTNPSGVGPGEAYVIYGRNGEAKLRGTFNLNSVGTDLLTGVTMAGIRTPQGSNQTDGMSSVTGIPDVDGDGRNELVFGFPDTDSRGHNIDPEQNGVVDPRSLATLEREGHFQRGGIVLVSSRNSNLADPRPPNTEVLLDMVGQDFDVTCVDPEPASLPAFNEDPFYTDIYNARQDCTGNCIVPQSDQIPDANTTINFGFVRALARDYWHSYVYSANFYGGAFECGSVTPFLGNPCLPFAFCRAFTATCEPFSPGLHRFIDDFFGLQDPFELPSSDGRSGFYVTFIEDANGNDIRNAPREPFGARVIGVGIGGKFGTSLTLSNGAGTGPGDIIVSAPARTARGILMGPFPLGCNDPPSCGGEIDGLESGGGTPKTNANSGVAYLFSLRSLWTADAFGRVPPRPHQYIAGEASHCGGPVPLIPNIDAIRIAGFTNDRITNILGIVDYNNDGRNDFAVGAPTANGGQGRVYIAYRRARILEGDYILEKLALDPNNPERLEGLLITTTSFDAFGSSFATDVDFNGDGISDFVVSSPDASAGAGEILIVFGGSDILSPEGGISINTLLTTRRPVDGAPVAARITGNLLDGLGGFGFNLANAGDVDGDGTNDLLIAAPGASPRFDPDPNDGVDELTELGVDMNLDGFRDEVPGDDNLSQAGIVYVILGSNRLDRIKTCTQSGKPCTSDADCDTGEVCERDDDMTISIDQLGTAQLSGFMIAGRRARDRIGGGDGGEIGQGGNPAKAGRARSFGLASAGDVDADGRADILIGSILADPRRDPNTDRGVQNAGEAYLIYGSAAP